MMTGVAAAMVTERDGGALVVKNATAAEAKQFFKEHPYEYTKERAEVPRVYFQRLPADWKTLPENESKHRMFIRMLLPLVLKINEEITVERLKVFELYAKIEYEIKLSEAEQELVDNLAAKYDAYTKVKGADRNKFLIKQLLKKVDIIPPSIMISTAIIYTNWGTSRLALEANSLYKEEVWYTNQGLRPLDDAGADYRYKVFVNLEDCLRQRALQLNSHINYDYFRHARQYHWRSRQSASGITMAAQMMHDSNLQNITGLIDYTLSFYKLEYTDLEPRLVDFYQ
jgi:Bax protein